MTIKIKQGLFRLLHLKNSSQFVFHVVIPHCSKFLLVAKFRNWVFLSVCISNDIAEQIYSVFFYDVRERLCRVNAMYSVSQLLFCNFLFGGVVFVCVVKQEEGLYDGTIPRGENYKREHTAEF